jgi:hypothetical protein
MDTTVPIYYWKLTEPFAFGFTAKTMLYLDYCVVYLLLLLGQHDDVVIGGRWSRMGRVVAPRGVHDSLPFSIVSVSKSFRHFLVFTSSVYVLRCTLNHIWMIRLHTS